MGAMKNPVTGEDELCSAETFTFEVGGNSYDYSGKYGEFCPFEYSN